MFRSKQLDRARVCAELEKLSVRQRMEYIAKLAIANKDDKALVTLISSLLDGNAYEAHLALKAIEIINHRELLFRALDHSYSSVRITAAGLLTNIASVEEIEQEIVKMSYASRRQVLQHIAKKKQVELAEKLIPMVFARWGANEAKMILPVCGPEVVQSWIGQMGYSITNWVVLARRHVEIVAADFQIRFTQATTRDRSRIWDQFASALERLCVKKTDLILDCALNFPPLEQIHPALIRHLGTLMDRNPQRLYELLTRASSLQFLTSNGVPKSIWARKNRFTQQQWVEIGKHLKPYPRHLATFFAKFAPSERTALFQAIFTEEELQTYVFSDAMMRQLPHRLRDQQADRMLQLREMQANPIRKMTMTAYRDIDQVREQLHQFTFAAQADERAKAITHLVLCTSLSRKGMSTTLNYLQRIKNEQDPVRMEVLSELARCHLALFREEDVPSLELLTDCVIEARDTSYGTRNTLKDLAFRLIRHYATNPKSALFHYAIQTIFKLAKQTGHLTLPNLEMNLPRGIEKAIFNELLPFIKDSLQRENASLLFSLASALGKRGHALDELQELLERAIQLKPDHQARQAIELWLRPHQTRDKRIRALLDRDPSAIVIDTICQHLHRKRQDWLYPYLTGQVIRGRFLTGNTVYLLPVYSGFHRWLPEQQQQLAVLLDRVITDQKRNTRERVRAIHTLANMPDLGYEHLQKYLKDDQVEIVEATLHALSLTEHAERALSDLMQHLDGDRARVAMYSVSKCMRNLPISTFMHELEELLSRERLKITVRKEAIRLLGAFKSETSLARLEQELAKQPHQDVMIAIGHAARQFFDDDRAWTLLSQLVDSGHRDVARSLLWQNRMELSPRHHSRYLDFILAIANHADPLVSKQAFHNMVLWSQGAEHRVAQACTNGLIDLEDQSKWHSATDAITLLARDGMIDDHVVNVASQLIHADLKEAWVAQAERDLPNRQRLYYLLDSLIGMPYLNRLERKAIFHGIRTELRTIDTLQHAYMTCALAMINWGQENEVIKSLRAIVLDAEQAPYMLLDLPNRIITEIEKNKGYWTDESLLALIDQLRAEQDDIFHRIALAMLQMIGKKLRWREDCAQRLVSFRQHPNAWIRSIAWDTFIASE